MKENKHALAALGFTLGTWAGIIALARYLGIA